MIMFEKNGKLNLNFGKDSADAMNMPANFYTYKDDADAVHAFVGATDLATANKVKKVKVARIEEETPVEE